MKIKPSRPSLAGSAAVAPSAASPASPTLRDLYLACLSADADQPERALSLARRALAVWNSQNA